jgi:hypothetical protein
MDHFAGLDVSVKETSVCILDDAGKIVNDYAARRRPRVGAHLFVLNAPNRSAS